MRLTLRTLLAYLDRTHLKNMLSDEEARSLEALGEKIGGNEFASGLVDRIHSSLSRHRLGAPKLDGRGIGLDPNTVAEFLDNSLQQERMQEFEKVCLESDVHLAEVAACHQILSLVLAERPDVPQGLRERIHRLPQQPIPVSSTSAAAQGAARETLEKAGETSRGVRPESPAGRGAAKRPMIEAKSRVPEYLRTSRRSSWKPLLATAALVLLLLAAGLLAMGSLDGSHPVLGPLLVDRSSPAVVDTPPVVEAERTPADDSIISEPRPPERVAVSEVPADAAVDENGLRDDVSEPVEPPVEERGEVDLAARVEAEPAELARVPDQGEEELPPDDLPPLPPSEDVAAAPPEAPRPAEQPVEDDPLASLARAVAPGRDAPRPAPEVDPLVENGVEDEAEEGDEVDGFVKEVGRIIAAERDHILARWDVELGAWFRAPQRAVLRSGERLLVLPSYRPQIALSSGIHIMFVGPTKVELGPTDQAGVPRLLLDEGRALLDTAGIAGSQLHLHFPALAGTLTFESTDSAVALDVRPQAQLGQDPGVREPVMGCEIHSTTGELTWRDREGTTTPLKSGQLLWLTAGQPPVVHDVPSPPSWISAQDQRVIDLRASRELAQLVDTSRPMSLSLFEQVGHRQIEVSALANESLTLVDEFDPLVQALRNERHHAYWRSYITALEAAIRRGPNTAAMVRAAFAKQRIDDAPILYRLLYGYNEQQLASGGAQELVALLESPLMEVRILAIENLRRITGRTLMYRPEREPIQQRRPLQDWRNTLNRGEITYRSAN
jgi:hypothetical protein